MRQGRGHEDGRINQSQIVIQAAKKRRERKPSSPGWGDKVNSRSLKGKEEETDIWRAVRRARPSGKGKSTCEVPEAERNGATAGEPGPLSHDQRVPLCRIT